MGDFLKMINQFMGAADPDEVGDNQEVEHQSGASKLCNSILCAICVAPILILAMVFVVGWNEKRAVCEERAILQGMDEVLEVKCTDATSGDGKLVMFSCDLDQNSSTALTLPNTDFSALSIKGTGLRVTSEMYQCVETVKSESKKDAVGGGTTTVKTYTYSKEWRSSHVNSGSFSKKASDNYKQNCNVDNPAWPSGVPTAETKYASTAKAGAFTLESDLVKMVSLDKEVTLTAPTGWTQAGTQYESIKWQVSASGASAQIGKVRVSLKSNDWTKPTLTVLGENKKGTMEKWTAADSWLCSGFTLLDLRMGTVDKEKLFEDLKSGATATTWVLRFVGFFALWFAFTRCAQPLEVVADCIPCVGPCLGDAVEMIACVVCCCPALACCMGVAGIVWVAMRPMVGIPLMLIFICTVIGMVAFKMYSKKNKESASVEEGGEVVGAPMDAE